LCQPDNRGMNQIADLQPGQDLRIYLADYGFTKLIDAQVVKLLLERQVIDYPAVKKLIETASSSFRTISQVALDQGLISSDDLFEVRAAINQLETVRLSEDRIEPGIAALLDSKRALEWRVIPYSRNDLGQLLVAISDPDAVAIQDNIRALFENEEVIFHLAPEHELSIFLERLYDLSREELSASLASGEPETEDFTVREEATDSAIINFVNKVIDQAREKDASDIHIETRADKTLVRFRIDGMLRNIIETNRRDAEPIIARLKHMSKMRAEERRVSQDGHIQLLPGKDHPGLDLRVVTLPNVNGEEVVLRLLDSAKAMTPLSGLGMSPENLDRYLEAINKPNGIALLTGPTGTGKSTTLYASLRETMSPYRKTISIEDPVEFRFEGMTQIDVSSGRLLEDSESRMNFASALRAVLRADPDIVMVGEIRDRETAEAAVAAAMTGHFIYSTLHTNDAMTAFARMRELGVSPLLLADSVEVIVSQRLIRKICPSCRIEYAADAEKMIEIGAPNRAIEWVEKYGERPLFSANPKGCPDCEGQGYRGRTAIHEVVRITDDIRDGVQEGLTQRELTALARGAGMASLFDDGFIRVWEGLTSIEEIRRVVA
jgi:type IV pilus assembly protein PilB